MNKDQAELFAEDISLVAQGIERFFARIEADPALRARPIAEIVVAIQETGALNSLLPLFEKAASRAAALTEAGVDLSLFAIARDVH